MRTRRLLIGGLLLACCALTNAADRYQTLLNAKHLTLTTRQGDTYYYIISTEATPMLRLGGDRVVVERDTFQVSDIKWMRLRTIPRFVLDEDSLTFGRDYAVDHGLLALRRSLVVNQWNSLVLPVELTGAQVRQVFGDDAQVAQVRGFHEGSNTQVDYELIDLNTRSAAMLANCHYIVRPTREPDVAASARMYSFLDERPYGPIYFIPNVTKSANQTARLQTVQNSDASRKVRFHGTFLRLDGTDRSGTVVRNKKVAPGMYYLNAEGRMAFSDDSLTVQAFRSWIQDVSSDPVPLRFYIDGIGEDITAGADAVHSIPEALGLTSDDSASGIYTLSGQRLGDATRSRRASLPKGIYIINGQKVAIK